MARRRRPDALPSCIHCGCTTLEACLNEYGEPCAWLTTRPLVCTSDACVRAELARRATGRRRGPRVPRRVLQFLAGELKQEQDLARSCRLRGEQRLRPGTTGLHRRTMRRAALLRAALDALQGREVA